MHHQTVDFLKRPSHLAVNACLAPICSMHGLAVTTVEGIGSTKTRLHPVQERIAKAHGSQCGFCTPGIVMSMYTLLRNSPRPTMDDLEVAFQGNLCRCTGYRPIIEGYRTFTEDWEVLQNGNGVPNGKMHGVCSMGDACCRINGNEEQEEEALFKKHDFIPYDPSQEPIFPPELKLHRDLDVQGLHFSGKNVEWYRPTSLDALLLLKHKHPGLKIIVGNTEVGVEVKFKNFLYPVLVQPNKVREMTDVEDQGTCLAVGASVTLLELENVLKEKISKEPEHKTRVFKAIVDMLHWFAGQQIRSVAAVGGNIMTASPISDLNPIFMAANVALVLQSKARGVREVKMDERFFTGYRKTVVEPDEVLVRIKIPYTSDNQFFYAYKQARRRDDDIAIVNAAFHVCFEDNFTMIKDIRMAFGGMAPTSVMAVNARKKLIGLPWNESTLEKAIGYLIEDLPLSASAPGGMIQYRRSLTISFFFRVFLSICQKLPGTLVDPRDSSAIDGFHSKPLKSSQYFQVVPNTQEKIDSVGRPIVHMSAYKQATGEAVYCDDMPFFENEAYMAFVYSTKAHAHITSVDASEALKTDGVCGFFSAKDIEPDRNRIGPVFHDEEVFISETATSQGQIIAAVVADDQLTAQKAARKVKVTYEELPVIITIEDAIKHNSFHSKEPLILVCGDVDKAFREAPHVIEGECRTGGQEHFYLETQCTIAVPKREDNEMELYCSTQHPSEVTVRHFYNKI